MASGEAKPLTRREARALYEAQQKDAKRRGKSAVAPEAGTETTQAPVEPMQAAPSAPVDSKQAKERAKAAFTAQDRSPVPVPVPTPAPVPAQELKVEGPAEHPPVSDSDDLAESGEPDAQRASVPTELLVGAPAEPKKSRAGRNLPAAIGVGVLMLGLVLVGLFLFEPLLVGIIIVLSGIGCWEIARATTHAKTSVPLVPLFLASAMLPISAIWGGLEALGFTYMICLIIALLVRLTEGLKGAAASVMSSVFIISWVPLLLSFALLILDEHNGQWLIATILLLAVSNDTFGYIVGVLFGKHPMAPKISPKKSWEGFAGSMLGSMAVGALAMYFWLDMPWWTGVILAFFTTIAATTGDFSESMIKRELGIKDMSNLLPGHGGIMDRLDSIVFVVPLGYLISHLLTWSVSLS
ncbi:phosphatidate cytidylyltransferase [Glutamicibacter sp. NPDC087344]|uniref:phosphatidate cytidylyltransferase n=1 Tax=Glutamicibacter sp. NPDC087344 TaxID=3363994 RepID=UPI0037F7EB06